MVGASFVLSTACSFEVQLVVFHFLLLSKGKALFILHVMIGTLSSHLMQSEIIIYGLVRKCVKLSPFS